MVALEEREMGRFNRRFAVHLEDGASVEAVLYRGDTLCVSSQVGCAVGCPFCASGARGLGRALHLQELVDQVEAVRTRGHALRRVTVSGVGEPLHNHAAVASFVSWCRRERLGPSVTTSGGPLPRLREWMALPHNGLTISVHAGTEELRRRLVPGGPALGPLFETVAAALPALSRSRRRKIALAYLLLAGENDRNAEIDAFLERAAPLGLAIHLYGYNPVGSPAVGFRGQAASRERHEEVYRRMRTAGLTVRMSSQARLEPNGGCGTLVALPGAGPRRRGSVAPSA